MKARTNLNILLEVFSKRTSLLLICGVFQIFGASVSQARAIETWAIAPLFRDQLEFLVCEKEPCSAALLKSAAEVLLSDLRSGGIRTNLASSDFCQCSIQASPIESLLSGEKLDLVRQLSRGIVRGLQKLGSGHPPWIQDVLLEETKYIYSQHIERYRGPGAFLRMQIRALEMMKKTRSLSSLSAEERNFLIQMTFVTGNAYNSSTIRKGCRGLSPEDFSCVSPAEMQAARRYMGNEFNDFNQNAVLGPHHKPHMTAPVRSLIDLIGKLEPAQTISFRGTGTNPALTRTQPGQVYTEQLFMSSSLDSKISQRFLAGVVQILMTRNCPLISGSGALFEGEFEVLCKPRTKLKMVHREFRGGNLYLFMEEVD